jgi:hypothetical protein
MLLLRRVPVTKNANLRNSTLYNTDTYIPLIQKIQHIKITEISNI